MIADTSNTDPEYQYIRGHRMMRVGNDWVYCDTGKTYQDDRGWERPCGKCGLATTPEGHDPCIANLPGVANACCGHGTQQGYIQFWDGRVIRGDFSIEPPDESCGNDWSAMHKEFIKCEVATWQKQNERS